MAIENTDFNILIILYMHTTNKNKYKSKNLSKWQVIHWLSKIVNWLIAYVVFVV